MKLGLIDWYIGRTTFTTMFVVACCGAALMFVFTLLDGLQGEDQALSSALLQTIRTLPRKIEELAPFAIFLGALLGMGTLSTNSELTVLRAAGVSVVRLFLSVCIPSIVMIVLAQMLIPNLFANDERGETLIQADQGGAWIREANRFTRIGTITSDFKLKNISQYRLDDNGAIASSWQAESAIEDANLIGWSLHNVNETTLTEEQLNHEVLDQGIWETPRSANSLYNAFNKAPRKMSLLQLSEQVEDLVATGQDALDFRVEYWQKVTKPFSVLGLVLIAVGFVIGSTREIGMGARLTFGIAVGFAFHYFQSLVAPLTIVFNLPPMVVICTPIALIWLIGLSLIRRVS